MITITKSLSDSGLCAVSNKVNMLRRYSYIFLWVVLMMLAGYGTYYAVMNQPDIYPADRTSTSPEEEIGSISARTTRVEEITLDGHIRWVLESVDLNGNIQGSFKMTYPKAVINVNDTTSITLTAPEGTYDSKTRDFHLSGGVTAIRDDDKSEFFSEEILFSSKTGILNSDGGDIKLIRGNWEFTAGQILVDLSGDKVIINLAEPVRILSYKL